MTLSQPSGGILEDCAPERKTCTRSVVVAVVHLPVMPRARGQPGLFQLSEAFLWLDITLTRPGD